MDELSEEDKLTVARARKIERFLSQPFDVAKVFTGSTVNRCRLEDTISSFKAVAAGEYDHLPEGAFYMVGGHRRSDRKSRENGSRRRLRRAGMADTMQFDLVSPERRLASMQVQAVLVPGADGDLTAMADHAPLITTLRPGMLRVESGEGNQEYLVTGGFAEIGTGLSVLAEQALLRADVTQEIFDTLAADAKATHDAAKSGGGDVDATSKRVADITAVGTELGMTTR